MNIAIESRNSGDVVVLSSKSFKDERGFFREVFRADLFKDLGMPHEFVQDTRRQSCGGCISSGSRRWAS